MQLRLLLTLMLTCCWLGLAAAQEPPADSTTPPAVPTPEEIKQQKQEEQPQIAVTPRQYNFRIGVIGDYEQQVESAGGTRVQVKSPLVLYNPGTNTRAKFVENMPGRVVAVSSSGRWIVAIAASVAVEGSSGAKDKECAVSIFLPGDEPKPKLLREFPKYSDFRAQFSPNDDNVVYYCVNEPAKENQIIRYNLESEAGTTVNADGNRFYLYGVKTQVPYGIWTEDPNSLLGYPVLTLLGLDGGEVLSSVRFPGSTHVVVRPGGMEILALVQESAETSLGYYEYGTGTFHQVPGLVLTRPEVKWLSTRNAVIAKESTVSHDRFLYIDLNTGATSELYSGYSKIKQWDIAPNDEALVFMPDATGNPDIYVLPLDTPAGEAAVINRLQVTDLKNISWMGCLVQPSSSQSWIDRLWPF
jgi:hypothetical protein